MGILGTLLALPVRIVNAPIRAAENFMSCGDTTNEEDRIFSKPLDLLSDELEKIDREKKGKKR